MPTCCLLRPSFEQRSYEEFQGLPASQPLAHAMAVVMSSSGAGALLWTCTGSGSGSINRLEGGEYVRKVRPVLDVIAH